MIQSVNSPSASIYACRWKACGAGYSTYEASLNHMRCHLRFDARKSQSDFDEEEAIDERLAQSRREDPTQKRASTLIGSSRIPFMPSASPNDSVSAPSTPSSPFLDPAVSGSRKRALSRSSISPSATSLTSQEAVETQLTTKHHSQESKVDSHLGTSQNGVEGSDSLGNSIPTGQADSPRNPFLDFTHLPSTSTKNNRSHTPDTPTRSTTGQVNEGTISMITPTEAHTLETTNSPQQSWYSAPPRRVKRTLPAAGEKERKHRRRSSTKHGSSKLRPLNPEGDSSRASTPLRNSISFPEF